VPLDTVLSAVIYRLREGCRWKALSPLYKVPHTTIYYWWRKWVDLGILDAIFARLVSEARPAEAHIDSTSAKVHKHANTQSQPPEQQCVGSSRGGRNTKIHGAVDENGRALTLIIGLGNAHDSRMAPQLVAGIRDAHVAADKAYDNDALRNLLAEGNNRASIPPKSNRRKKIEYDKETYKRRHKVENFFQRLKECRALATRYEKLSSTYFWLVTLWAIMAWMIP